MNITTPIVWRLEPGTWPSVYVADHADLGEDLWVIIQMVEFAKPYGYMIRRNGVKVTERRTLKLAKDYVARALS